MYADMPKAVVCALHGAWILITNVMPQAFAMCEVCMFSDLIAIVAELMPRASSFTCHIEVVWAR